MFNLSFQNLVNCYACNDLILEYNNFGVFSLRSFKIDNDRTCDIDRYRERTCTRQTFGVKNLLFLSNECRLIVLNVLFHDNVEADTRPSNVKMLHND